MRLMPAAKQRLAPVAAALLLLQAAVGVVQRALRPPVPPGTPPALAQLMQSCWEQDPALRPTFK